MALARRQLEHALKIKLTPESEAQLREYADGLPELLTAEPQEGADTARGGSR
jgi:hypothetical protein